LSRLCGPYGTAFSTTVVVAGIDVPVLGDGNIPYHHRSEYRDNGIDRTVHQRCILSSLDTRCVATDVPVLDK
jgi:hypothetical protein